MVFAAGLYSSVLQAFPVYVATSTGILNRQLELEPTEPIYNVKQQIQDRLAIPPDQQILFYKGIRIEDNHFLNDYNIQSGDTIELNNHTIISVVPGSGFNIKAGTIISVDGLDLTPSSDFILGTSLVLSGALNNSTNIVPIGKSYQFSATTTAYSGLVKINYQESELNGLDESALKLLIHNGSSWSLDYNSSSNTAENVVFNNAISGVALREISAATCSPNTGDTTAVVCGSFVWYGVTYNSSATPTHTFTNVRGCDSVVTLHLTIQSVVPTKPASITQTLVSNVCGARVYRYSASSIANGLQYVWVLPNSLGGDNSAITLDSGTINSKTILVKYLSNNGASTTDSIKVASYNGCKSSYTAAKLTITSMKVPAAPVSFTGVAVKASSCGVRTYRMTAPSLPIATATTPAANGYVWSFVGNLSNYITIDSGTVNSQIIIIKCSSNEAAAIGDSIRLCYTSICGNSPRKAYKLNMVKLSAPNPPTLYATNSLVSNECGARVYRYSASSFTSGFLSIGNPTGYLWSFTGTLGANAVIDSGTINSQTIKVRFTINNAASTDDSVRVAFTSGCGNSAWKSVKLTNTLLDVPAAPASVTIALVSDICGARVYRYTAPALTAASTTRGVATGYLWTMPFGTLGATGLLDSADLSSRVIKIRYSSNAAAATGDSIKVQFTSGCGNSAAKAQKLSNVASVLLLAPASLTGTTSICSIVGTATSTRYTATAVTGTASYLWTIPSGAVIDSGSNGLKIKVRFNTAGTNDSIYVQAVGTNGCASAKKVLKLTTTGCATIPTSRVANPVVKMEESMSVSVFPNPSKSYFNLQVITSGKEIATARILEIQGRLIKSLVITPNQIVNMGSELKPGAYFIEVTQGKEVKTTRVVKF